MRIFGLIGRRLGHSFSSKFFSEKFEQEGILDAKYHLFELSDLSEFPVILRSKPNIQGLNVTIPYKTDIIPYLTALDESAEKVGAVNTIKFTTEGTIGYNTDLYGFQQSLENWFNQLDLSPANIEHLDIYILGTGGAAKAVAEALRRKNLTFTFVSRRKTHSNAIDYSNFANIMNRDRPTLIVNTTPLGMYPDIETYPPVRFNKLTPNTLVYDLVYNPAKTSLLQQAEAKGCPIKNGIEMLHLQAEMAWKIWNT